ncbi:NTP transferase domain-containing protein [Pseudoalteromonas sp. MMG022]|uniref:NTP transferase domain-containing protein n=1 Tax=Pseudoalteromonas sp. MMG022 TaxID=2909978 RepID=UPI001F431A75|nr:NTP transferase domain-containing protein [Pseudoalteromonas sp. MMG022]MCF6435983.1 NTP transferase domain-containing protein [Pseudoalteromonas sp. MMG022]
MLVVLAAGLGSRFGGGKQIALLPKVNRTIMELSIEDAYHAGVREVILVINAQVKAAIQQDILPRLPSQMKVTLVEQSIRQVPEQFASYAAQRQKPWGTGHALLCAKAYITKPAIVITADDYYGPTAYQQMVEHFHRRPEDMAMVAYPLLNTLSQLGGVNRGICQLNDDKLISVKEYTDIYHTAKGVVGCYEGRQQLLPDSALASMTFWGITPKLIESLEQGFVEFLMSYDNGVKKEYYLPNCIEQCIVSRNLDLIVYSAEDHWYGVTFKEELAAVAGKIHEQR